MPAITLPSAPSPTHYDVLGVPAATLSALDEPTATALIKRSYRRALLSHHPDKTNSTPSGRNTFTIDQISTAYATLSRPSQRASYDRSLLLQRQQQQGGPAGLGPGSGTDHDFKTGIDTVDLDDLESCTEKEGDGDPTTRWYRACRCGNPRGYTFTEDDLEEAADLGELMVGCADCSLWLKVEFAVVDDDEEDEGRG